MPFPLSPQRRSGRERVASSRTPRSLTPFSTQELCWLSPALALCPQIFFSFWGGRDVISLLSTRLPNHQVTGTSREGGVGYAQRALVTPSVVPCHREVRVHGPLPNPASSPARGRPSPPLQVGALVIAKRRAQLADGEALSNPGVENTENGGSLVASPRVMGDWGPVVLN